ncbi:MAG TPA: FtsX-like permease family protein [Thermoanaerobaculia bacterium]|nr:FtsX-like permease family protein [Thermoanaerobaculia bacterium]
MIARALVLRPLIHEKLRTALTVLGIGVGVSVVVAIQLANQSVLRAFRESVDAVTGRANYQIAADAGLLDESLILRLQWLWDRGGRFAPVIDVEGIMQPSQLPIRLLAVDLLSDLHFREYRYATILTASHTADAGGATPYLELFRTDSVVLPAPFARENGITIGDPIVLSFGGKTSRMVVRGLLEARGPATAFNGSIAICDIAAAQTSFGWRGQLTRIDLLVPENLVGTVAKQLPPGTRIERPSRRNERVERMLRAFRVNLFALAGVALLVGMFLVYNTVLISILRRRHDVGVLKTLGVSPRQVFAAFLGEGLLFGLIGSILGIALGNAMAEGMLGLVGRTVNELYVTSQPESVQLTPRVLVTGMAVGMILALISAVHPAIEAAQVRPNTMIRPGLQQRIRSTTVLITAAILCFAASALAARIPPLREIAVGGYLSVVLVVGGFSLLAPSIVRRTSAIFKPLLTRLFGIVGRLAAASLPASLRRTSVASAALSLATGMMVAVALMVGSFRETVRIWVDQTVKSDLWLRPAKGLSNADAALFPPSIADEVERMPFVKSVDRVRGRNILYGDTLIEVGSGEFTVTAVEGTIPMVKPRSMREALLEAIRLDGVFISESFALKFHKDIGDTVRIPIVGGTRQFTITGIYRDYSNDRGVVVMNRPTYVRSFKDDALNTVIVFLKPGADREQARLELQRIFGPKYHAFAISNVFIRKQVMTIFDQTFMITYALLGIAIIVAVLGIVNTLAALILERTRELALLRVSGMSRRQLTTMLVLESSLIGMASTVVGIVMGYVLSLILIYVINRQSFGWTIEFHTPVTLIATSLAITFAASVVAGLVPARLASRIDLVTAIKSE